MRQERLIVTQEERGKFGYTIFAAASKKAPASVTAQGAYIAFACRKAQVDLGNICAALVNDGSLIDHLIETAKINHRRSAHHIPEDTINPMHMRSIIRLDFEIAGELGSLGDAQLKHIYESLYRQYGAGTAESKIREALDELYGIKI